VIRVCCRSGQQRRRSIGRWGEQEAEMDDLIYIETYAGLNNGTVFR
jgi:hypothetical protein